MSSKDGKRTARELVRCMKDAGETARKRDPTSVDQLTTRKLLLFGPVRRDSRYDSMSHPRGSSTPTDPCGAGKPMSAS